jgi:hypothetical protein
MNQIDARQRMRRQPRYQADCVIEMQANIVQLKPPPNPISSLTSFTGSGNKDDRSPGDGLLRSNAKLGSSSSINWA